MEYSGPAALQRPEIRISRFKLCVAFQRNLERWLKILACFTYSFLKLAKQFKADQVRGNLRKEVYRFRRKQSFSLTSENRLLAVFEDISGFAVKSCIFWLNNVSQAVQFGPSKRCSVATLQILESRILSLMLNSTFQLILKLWFGFFDCLT